MNDAVIIALVGAVVALFTAVSATLAAINAAQSKQAAAEAKDVAMATAKQVAELIKTVEKAALIRGRAEGEQVVRAEVAQAEVAQAEVAQAAADQMAVTVTGIAEQSARDSATAVEAIDTLSAQIRETVEDTHAKVDDIHHEVVPASPKDALKEG